MNDSQCSGNNTCKLFQGQNYCDCVDGTTGFFCEVSGLPGELSFYFFCLNFTASTMGPTPEKSGGFSEHLAVVGFRNVAEHEI